VIEVQNHSTAPTGLGRLVPAVIRTGRPSHGRHAYEPPLEVEVTDRGHEPIPPRMDRASDETPTEVLPVLHAQQSGSRTASFRTESFGAAVDAANARMDALEAESAALWAETDQRLNELSIDIRRNLGAGWHRVTGHSQFIGRLVGGMPGGGRSSEAPRPVAARPARHALTGGAR
jgi:hypothetical protein